MKNEGMIYLVINRFFSFYTLRINMAKRIFFVLLNTNRKRSTHTDRQTDKTMTKENEMRKAAYIQRRRRKITWRDTVKIINKEIFILHRCQWFGFELFFVFIYTQLDGLVGFFTSHNCEILMSHCETPAPARHILILATDVHLNKDKRLNR